MGLLNNVTKTNRPITTIFFDRDGVINEVVRRGEVISSPRQLGEFKVLADFDSHIDEIGARVSNTFVVSNQPDVSRNLLSLDEHNRITEKLRNRFLFTEIRYCEHDDFHQCECRKPKPGMILELLSKHELEAGESIIIGDTAKDILAGQGAGIKTILYRQSYNSGVSGEADFVIESFAELFSLPLLWSKQ